VAPATAVSAAEPRQRPNALAGGVRRGYATVGSNTGHEGNSSYALDHPEQIKDFGYRSVHQMTVAAKTLIRAFYGRAPKLSLMAEAGGGTIAALSAAQRYPADYDGLAVGHVLVSHQAHLRADVGVAGDARE